MQNRSTRAARARRAGALLAGLFLVAGAQPQEAPTPLPERDPRIQAEIRRALDATRAEEFSAALETLRDLAGPDFQALVPQLFLFSREATDTKEAMAFGVLREELRIPDLSIVRALVPFLETADVELRRALAGVLSEFEDPSADRPPDFTIYRPLLEERRRAGSELPLGLVRHLYATDPGVALLLLTRLLVEDVPEHRDLLWAEHVVADSIWRERFGFLAKGEVVPEALEQVRFLSAHPRWWVRLYAAAVMSRHPALRRDDALATLRRDEHPLVRELAAIPDAPAGPR